jgi:hypothetical protein
MKEMIGKYCEIMSAESVASLDATKRDEFEEVAGFHNLESISVAKEVE